MVRTLIASSAFLLVLIAPGAMFAAPTAPAQTVRANPANAKKGNEVTLEALVYNNTGKTVSVDVSFATPAEELETITLTIPTQSAKTASTEWTVPDQATVVTASVVKAVDANQRNVPELLGIVGTVSVGSNGAGFSLGNLTVGAETWFGSVFSAIDPWRQKQAEHFTKLRNDKRAELGISSASDLNSRLAPKYPEAPAVPGEGQRMGDLNQHPSFPIESYAVLLYASALATIFASIVLFYVTAGLLLIFVLRFFFRMFR